MGEVAGAVEVARFWQEAGPERWFAKDESFDAACRARFLETYEAAARGDLGEWELSPEGALAVVLLLDQFPRNIFRGTRRIYATDPTAVLAAERAIEKGYDRMVDPALRHFFYLPFMHAEELHQQERCVSLCRELGDPEQIHWAEHHRDIIARFGRFPHRNALLGRESTAEEEAFLAADDFRG
jgi:uncharacterized protein (DUF924 family)